MCVVGERTTGNRSSSVMLRRGADMNKGRRLFTSDGRRKRGKCGVYGVGRRQQARAWQFRDQTDCDLNTDSLGLGCIRSENQWLTGAIAFRNHRFPGRNGVFRLRRTVLRKIRYTVIKYHYRLPVLSLDGRLTLMVDCGVTVSARN